VKPDRKLSVREIAAIFRDHFEGTTLDSTDSYRISPHRSPVRSICCDASHRTTIIQQRDWMPPEIGTVVWRALEPPCLSVFVPWYLGITRIPAAFQAAPERADTTHFDRLFYHFALPGTSTVGTTTVYAAPGSAASGAAAAGAGGVTTAAAVPEASGDVFKLLGNLVDENYRERIGRVGKVWEDFEAEEYAMQPAVEETALRLFEQDTALAREFLTLYSNALAEKSLGTAKVLIGEMRPAGK
jgi:dipeptidase